MACLQDVMLISKMHKSQTCTKLAHNLLSSAYPGPPSQHFWFTKTMRQLLAL